MAAALLAEAGHEVVGVTMKLWGGASDTGCCSVSDVDDARRVCDHLGIEHHVFNFGEEFNQKVVAPYVADHQAGRTPNPCVECNRHIKFDRLLKRAEALGFDAVATGHHARIVRAHEGVGNGDVADELRAASGNGSDPLKGDVSDQGISAQESGTPRLARGADAAKDQSYVLWMLGEEQLERLLLPVGEMTKQQVREAAERLGIRTAQKPDSQDVCFITRSEGRKSFLQERMETKPAKVITTDGEEVGRVPAVELVTIGQRKNLGIGGMGEPKFVLEVDVAEGKVVVGNRDDRLVDAQPVAPVEWVGEPADGPLLVQCRAHGKVAEGRVVAGYAGSRDAEALRDGSHAADFSGYEQTEQTDVHILWSQPQPRVAPARASFSTKMTSWWEEQLLSLFPIGQRIFLKLLMLQPTPAGIRIARKADMMVHLSICLPSLPSVSLSTTQIWQQLARPLEQSDEPSILPAHIRMPDERARLRAHRRFAGGRRDEPHPHA